MASESKDNEKGVRDAPKIMDFLTIGGNTYSLGNLRKSDFSSLEDPKASVISIQQWAIQLNNILKGISE